MKPGEETPQNWQQPNQSPPQAPFQTTPIAPPSPAAYTPVPMQSSSTTSAAAPQVVSTSSDQTTMTEATSVSSAQPVDTVTTSIPSQTISAPVDQIDQEQVDTDDQQTAEGEGGENSIDNEDNVLLRWQAMEYIHHERTAVWYGVLAIVVVAFITLALLVFHSVTFAILIPVMLVALIVYIRRPPSILNYTLSRKGLHVNDHLYTYDQFKAFGVVSHEELHSVVLIPRKRFQVSQTIYFPEEIGESLVDMLAARLPMQEVRLDTIDRLLKKLRI